MASKMQTLDDLYMDMLKDLYSAEKQLVKALPKLAKNAQSSDLQKAFQDHLRQTEGHVERIELEEVAGCLHCRVHEQARLVDPDADT